MKIRIFLAALLAIGLLYGLFSCTGDLSVETMQYATNGQKVYVKHCQNCHGANGEGLGTLYPPLTDKQYLKENREHLACIVKHGMSGPIQVNGKTFDQQMPGVPTLPSLDIAYVLTYVTTYFGASKTHFTKEEIEEFLRNCK